MESTHHQIQPHNLALFEKMGWDIIEEAPRIMVEEFDIWEIMEGPNMSNNNINVSKINNSIIMDNIAALPDFHDTVALDLVKMGMKSESSSCTISVSMESIGSMKSSQQLESPHLSLGSGDCIINAEGIIPEASLAADNAAKDQGRDSDDDRCLKLAAKDVRNRNLNSELWASAGEHKKKGSKKFSCKIIQKSLNVQVDQQLDGDSHAHIFTERERRKKMRILYDNLQNFLGLPKADKASIVEATISKIQMLETAKKLLLKQKSARKLHKDDDDDDDLQCAKNDINTGSDHSRELRRNCNKMCANALESAHQCFDIRDPLGHVELHVSGSTGLFTISMPKLPTSKLATTIVGSLLNNNLEVLNAHISSTHDKVNYSVHTQACDGGPRSSRDCFNLAYRELTFRLSAH